MGVLAWLARLAYRHPRKALGAALLVSLAAAWKASSLRLDTDLVHLLPRTFDSVQRLEELDRRTLGGGYVSLVASGADTATLTRLAAEVTPKLGALDTIGYVDDRRPSWWLRDRALYFLDTADLRVMRDRIAERRLWELRSRVPLLDLGLDELGERPALDFDDILAKYREHGASVRGGQADQGYVVDRDEGLLVLLARPAHSSTDVGFSGRVVADVERLIAGLDLASYGPDLRVEVSGRHKKKVDQKRQAESDLQRTSALALVLIVGFLALHFRRAAAVLLVLAPLVMGVIWTLAAAAVLFGSLNLLTGFVGALLFGLGVDHGIHLLARVDRERGAGEPLGRAVATAFATTGRAVVVAALTTVFAFLGVAISQFRAFRELGVLAALGLLLIVIAYTVGLPALLGLVGLRPRPARQPSAVAARLVPKWAPVTGWLAVLLAVAAAALSQHNRFDYDLASLEDWTLRSFQLDRRVNELLGRSQTPLVVMADGPAHEARIAARLRQAERARGSTIAQVAALGDLVPADQTSKRALLADIRRDLLSIDPKWLDAGARRWRQRLLDLCAAAPFGRADLPVEVRRRFAVAPAGGQQEGSLVLVFPAVSQSDGQGIRRLAEELRSLALDDGSRLAVAGESMVLADLIALVASEAPVILSFTAGLVLLALLLLLPLGQALACTVTAMITMVVTAGLMPLVGLHFNYLDIVMVPLLFGMAVDGAVHMLSGRRHAPDVAAVVSTAGRAVAGAIFTTMLGFGTLAIAHHPGLASIGRVALLGLSVNLLVCLVALPSWLVLLDRARRVRRSAGPVGLWTRLAVTLGLAGDAPVGPGTLGALIALPLALAAQRLAGPLRAGLCATLVVVSVALVSRYLRGATGHDPSEVVIDELVGCLVAVALVPRGLGWALSAFLLFRVLDILKPWPIGFIDRRVRGAWGVVGDDLAAGLLSGAMLAGVHRLGTWQRWWM